MFRSQRLSRHKEDTMQKSQFAMDFGTSIRATRSPAQHVEEAQLDMNLHDLPRRSAARHDAGHTV